MKKAFLIIIAIFTINLLCFANTAQRNVRLKPSLVSNYKNKKQPSLKAGELAKRQAAFNRLNLTEKQIEQVKSLKKQKYKEMEPVIKSIQEKKERIEAINKESLSSNEKQEIQELKMEIRKLRNQLYEKRVNDMKDYETILTKKQLKELNKNTASKNLK